MLLLERGAKPPARARQEASPRRTTPARQTRSAYWRSCSHEAARAAQRSERMGRDAAPPTQRARTAGHANVARGQGAGSAGADAAARDKWGARRRASPPTKVSRQRRSDLPAAEPPSAAVEHDAAADGTGLAGTAARAVAGASLATFRTRMACTATGSDGAVAAAAPRSTSIADDETLGARWAKLSGSVFAALSSAFSVLSVSAASSPSRGAQR